MYRNQFQYDDPYNYKPLQRNDLMSLSSINQQDIGFPRYQNEQPRDLSLKTNDIRGSQTKGPYPFQNKEDYINRNDDIIGSQPKKLLLDAREAQYRDNTLNIDNIAGSKPRINKFETMRQPTNPLEPSYQLSQVQLSYQEPPKFIKDQLEIDDIDGARAKKDKSFIPRKNPYVPEEIEGSRAKKQFIPKDKFSNLDVKDINRYKQWTSNRHTDHFNPQYVNRDDENNRYTYGEIDRSHPRTRHPVHSQSQTFSLQTKDINGAQADTHANKFLRKDERKDYRSINDIQDIYGAQKDTLKRGLQSNRYTNPLIPQYTFLGQSEEQQGQFPNVGSYQKEKDLKQQQQQQQQQQTGNSSQFSFGKDQQQNQNQQQQQQYQQQNILGNNNQNNYQHNKNNGNSKSVVFNNNIINNNVQNENQGQQLQIQTGQNPQLYQQQQQPLQQSQSVSNFNNNNNNSNVLASSASQNLLSNTNANSQQLQFGQKGQQQQANSRYQPFDSQSIPQEQYQY